MVIILNGIYKQQYSIWVCSMIVDPRIHGMHLRSIFRYDRDLHQILVQPIGWLDHPAVAK